MDAEDILLSPKYRPLLDRNPLFAANQLDGLTEFLSNAVAGGDGMVILQRIEESQYRPSKKLMEHVSGVIKGNASYVLLDEQLVVFDKVLAAASAAGAKAASKTLI